MPSSPGFSHGSPSSVIPCTAMATSAVSATCSWTFTTVFFTPGPCQKSAAIERPSVTEVEISRKATTPAEREASHQM